jgi:O-antigen ligase
MLGLSAWLMMATPFSSWPGGSVELLKESWSKALLFFLVLGCMVTTTRQSITIMRTMAWAVLICALLSFRYGTYVDGRLQMAAGQYTNPNELGNLMAVGAVLWWSTLHYSRRSLLTFVLAIGCIALLLLVASRTGSRMVMLVLAASMPALLTRYSMAGRVAFVGASGLAFLMLLLALPGETIRRFTTFFTIQQETVTSEEAYESYLKAVGSANQRVELLKTSVLFTLQHPVFGVGPGMFAVAQNEVAGAFGRAGAWRGTHNTYTELSSEAGIPALLLFVGAMITCWRQLGALRRRNDQLQHPARADIDQAALTIRVLMLGTAVQFLFIHAAYSVIFPTIAGLAVGLVRGANNDLDQVDPAKAPAVPFSGR